MAVYDKPRITDMFTRSEAATTSIQKGKIFEDLACYLFEVVPGVSVAKRNALNLYLTEEVDISIWNDRDVNGFSFLDNLILIECKNWSKPVGSSEVNWFATKVEDRGLYVGFLIAANGITGEEHEISRAKSIVSSFLKKHIRIIVINKSEILAFDTTDDLLKLTKEKLCELIVNG